MTYYIREHSEGMYSVRTGLACVEHGLTIICHKGRIVTNQKVIVSTKGCVAEQKINYSAIFCVFNI